MKKDTINMAHLGARAFEEIGGEVVQTTSFVIRNSHTENYTGKYARLVDYPSQQEKEDAFLSTDHCPLYTAQQSNFSKIPGSPVAYWVSKTMISAFDKGVLLGTIADSKQGLATSDNNRFLREWYEIELDNIKFDSKNIEESVESGKKWFPYNKGGDFRRWYGNNDYVVNWENNGREIRNCFDEHGKLRSRPQNTDFYFRESASWSLITSGTTAFRYKPY
ncbi:MAG: BREX-1 system adenine-specific DNA-methyltransferase PglX [Clostridiales bacterium]|nr:BREX-1 system adenine-specific DNA-methyltransferase PglX [Clostridiales bacterium]